MFLSPPTDQARKTALSTSSSGEEEDESPTKATTRKSIVGKKAISDDNGNIVTPVRTTTRVTRSKGAAPSVVATRRVTTRKGDKAHKKEEELEDESSDDSENDADEEQEDVDVISIEGETCDKTDNVDKKDDNSTDENVEEKSDEDKEQEDVNKDETAEEKVENTESIPNNDSSHKSTGEEDSSVTELSTKSDNSSDSKVDIGDMIEESKENTMVVEISEESLTKEVEDKNKNGTTEAEESKENVTTEEKESQENVTTEEKESKENVTTEEKESKENVTTEEKESKENVTMEVEESKENMTMEEEESKENVTTEEKESKENVTTEKKESKENVTTEEKESKENVTMEVEESKENMTMEEEESKENVTMDVDETKDNTETENAIRDEETSGERDDENDSNSEEINIDNDDPKLDENNGSDKEDEDILDLEEDEGQLQIVENDQGSDDDAEVKEESNGQGESTLTKVVFSSIRDKTCDFCGVVKKSPADLQRHVRKHTGERPFRCELCSRMFKAKRSLQYHEFMHHGIKSENSNISQKYSLMRKRKLEMDQLRAELITPDGTKRFKGEDSPDVALMDGMTRQEGKDSSTSPESGADVDSLSDRTCYVCGKLCLKPSDLKRHMMCHTGERPFKCDLCGKPFRAKNSMLYHKKSAHGIDIELSPGLEERFHRLKKQTVTNYLTSKMEGPVSETPKQPISNGSEGDFEEMDSDDASSLPVTDGCDVANNEKVFYSCGYTSSFRDDSVELDESTGLFKHKRSGVEPGTMNNDDDDVPPDITQMIKDGSNMVGSEIIHGSHFVKNRISIRNETVLVTRLDGVNLATGKDMSLYKCYMCGKVFNYLSKIQCHLSMHFEKDIVIFQCQLCKASFMFKNQVMQHIRKKHPFEVDNMKSEVKQEEQESKSTDADNDTSNSDMDSGIQVKSEGNEENSDEREGSSSPVESNLGSSDIFKKQDDDENNSLCRFWRGLKYRKNTNGSYVCLVCRKSFHREISLLKHIKIHSSTKQCYCDECGKGFSEYRFLRHHIAVFHGHQTTKEVKPHIKASTKHTLLSNLLSKQGSCIQPETSAATTHKTQVERAREILIKEGIQEDVTVVMPCGPEEDNDMEDNGNNLSVLDVWSERDSEESNSTHSQDGLVTPVVPRRSLRKEMSKSKRKSSQPVKLQNVTTSSVSAPLQVKIPVPRPTQVLINGDPTRTISANVTLPARLEMAGRIEMPGRIEVPGKIEVPDNMQIKQEPLSPTSDAMPTPMPANAPMAQFFAASGSGYNQVILASNSGGVSTSGGHAQPMMLLSNTAFPSPISGSIIGMVQVTNSANKGPVLSDSSTPMSSADPSPNTLENGERDSLVGFPRVQWSPNETPPTSDSGGNFGWSQISADGRKVTSLSRTHSRLPIVNAPVNRDKVCKPMTLTDGRQVYRCPFCSKDFLSYSDINRHMDFHEDIRPYKCKYCDYFARTNSQLKVHMMRHQGIREFCCKVCNYKGVTQSDLNRHMKSQIHILKSRNECFHCGEGFVTHKNLEKHMNGNCIVRIQKVEDTSDF